MSKLISIIIPCYNVEKYIDRCYQSLAEQTIGIDSLELIFIDDASTDSTWAHLVEIEKKAPESVMIVHCEENGRQGKARNIGLQYASAPYISFVDADDWVDSSMYERFYSIATKYNCDLVSCQMSREYAYSPTLRPERTGEDRLLLIDSIANHKAFILAGSIGYVIVGKLFRKDMILEHQMFFPENLAYEDNLWCMYPYLYAEHVYILDETLYHYFVNTHSTVLSKNQDYHSDCLTVNLLKWQEWQTRGFLELYRPELEYDFLTTCFLGYLKVLFLRFSKVPYEQFLLLKQTVLDIVPNYQLNPYIQSNFTEFNQLLLHLLSMDVTESELNEFAHLACKNWLSVTIFTATHVAFTPPSDSIYIPLHVGHSKASDLGYPGDDTGDNISDLNCYYSELTGLYWIWKNYFNSNYVGLCHYRRYFVNEAHQLLDKDTYLRILGSYDIIISKPYMHENSYYDNYKEAHHIEDLIAVENAISKLYPEHLEAFREVIYGNVSYIGNLFVTSRENLEMYCEWLFSVFTEASNEIHPDSYDAYHRRVYGFLSEQLLFVWVKAMKLTYYECAYGLSQEKEETLDLKKKLFEFIQKREFKEANDYFHSYMKDRPDVLLETADLSQELRLLYQIIYVALAEKEPQNCSLITFSEDYDKLIAHYKRLLSILQSASENTLCDDDKQYIIQSQTTISILNTIKSFNPVLKDLDIQTLFYKE